MLTNKIREFQDFITQVYKDMNRDLVEVSGEGSVKEIKVTRNITAPSEIEISFHMKRVSKEVVVKQHMYTFPEEHKNSLFILPFLGEEVQRVF